jgi:ankyrin repeat protein
MNVRRPQLRASTTIVTAAGVLALVATTGARQSSQAQAPIDFARDVQPLLKERCVECHGPTKQNNGYRLDRRSVALAGVTRPNIVPRSSESSRLFRRVSGPEFGTQMPPDDPLTPAEIDVLKRWIDQGADWPDALANERALPPEEPAVTRVTEKIRMGHGAAALEEIRRAPGTVNGHGPGGSTALMFAALYGDAGLVADLLKAGADPNVRNHAGASALTWALDDIEKVRLLVDRGADVNAVTDFGRVPLTLAAAQAGSIETVKLLLQRGATVNPAALTAASSRGDAGVVRVLIAAGARDDNGAATAAALRSNCGECLEAIAGASKAPALSRGLLAVLPTAAGGHPDAVRQALERGADVNVRDLKSRTPLMLAAISDTLPPASVKLLIERGADVNARDPEGRTALDFARRLGHTTTVDVLVAAGASAKAAADPPLDFVRNNTVRGAVERSLPLLQRTATQFYDKSGCLSCHHNALTAMTVAAARIGGFPVNETSARHELATAVKDIDATREQALQGIVSPGGFVTTTGYILMGLAAEGHKASPATDALVRLLRTTQQPDGRWRSPYRPPTEASEFTATAVSLRGVQLYGSKNRPSDAAAIRAATSWLVSAQPKTTEDLVFRIFGLTWGDAPRAARESATRDLKALQRADGGWAQLPSMQSDAYATGSALVALLEAGTSPTDDAYKRGIVFLLRTQLADGSWYVPTRSHQTQIYFESGFPHGVSQFVSAAATNWATQALVRGGSGR